MRSLRSFLLILPLGLCFGTSDGRAEMPPVADSQQDLQHRLDALGTHFHGGSLARWQNAEDQKVLKDMWDLSLLGLPPYSAKDVSALATMLKAQASVLRLYTTAGKAVSGSEKEVRVRTKYQDEIVRSSAFLVATSAALLQAMGEFVSLVKPEQLSTERRKSIDEGRSGIRSLLESFNDELKLQDVTSGNKTLLLDALVANAETIATYSPDADRKRYSNAANAILTRLAEPEKAKLQSFIAAMSTKTCRGLCALGG